jgi:hypothetical protein
MLGKSVEWPGRTTSGTIGDCRAAAKARSRRLGRFGLARACLPGRQVVRQVLWQIPRAASYQDVAKPAGLTQPGDGLLRAAKADRRGPFG